MLQNIQIKNYAIIKEVTLNFYNGLHVITGETGAGKSILLGALAAILGERFDTSKLFNAQEKCLIEGQFNVANNNYLKAYLIKNDFEADDLLILRREVAPNGKSRSFINDTPATLAQLQYLGTLLVDLHRQFDTQDVATQSFQTNVLDAYAENGTLLTNYKTAFSTYKTKQAAFNKLQQSQIQFQKDKDYDSFLYAELETANFKPNEIEDADTQLKIMNSAEAIAAALQQANFNFTESESPIITQLKQIINNLQPYTSTMPALAGVHARLVSCHTELDDVATELVNLNDHISFDAEKFAQYQDRIDLGYRLLKKHSLLNTSQLLELQQALNIKLSNLANAHESLQQLATEMDAAKAAAEKIAIEITKKRNNCVPALLKALHIALAKVEMPNAQLQIDIKPTALNSDGADAIQFLLDANKSGKFNAIQKVASGGELSRLMLCVKSLVAHKMELPTMIFDEIDTGISGEACKQVGIIMEQLASTKQLICITHQPQIAAKGSTHYFVSKKNTNGIINTIVKQLQADERTLSIAQMIGGANPTDASIKSAKEMMGIL